MSLMRGGVQGGFSICGLLAYPIFYPQMDMGTRVPGGTGIAAPSGAIVFSYGTGISETIDGEDAWVCCLGLKRGHGRQFALG